ncbi:AAA family ATPase [Aeromonas media]|nr:AAA family ATPase [Aeromonas media]
MNNAIFNILGIKMLLKSFKINNYRSILSELKFDTGNRLSLVGPNNSGKTNILKAIQLFFGAKENQDLYSVKKDIPFSSRTGQSSFSATFELNKANDNEDLIEKIIEISEMVGVHDPSEITLYLTFSRSGNSSYRLYSGVKRSDGVTSNEYTALERKIVEMLLSKFECIYVPSAKSVDQLYTHLVLPYLRKVASERLLASYEQLTLGLHEISSSVNDELKRCGLSEYTTSFNIPEEKLENIISRFEFSITDSQETDIFNKGMGIQCAALFSTFSWITNQKINAGKEIVWLIEEPESYLHPELTRNCKAILDSLSKISCVITSTHSLSFIDTDPTTVIGVEKEHGNTVAKRFKDYTSATNSIRSSLGVKFSDFFNFTDFNIFLEGELDREYLKWFLEASTNYDTTKERWPCLRAASLIDFGGVKFLTGFLKANYKFLQPDTACVSMFDGDQAGISERKEIQNYIQNKLRLQFEAFKQFVSIRLNFAIEGLFCDEWLLKLYNEHRSYFKDFSIDATGTVEPFSIDDLKKKNVYNYLTNTSLINKDEDIEIWGKRWVDVCEALEKSLVSEANRLSIPIPSIKYNSMLSLSFDQTTHTTAHQTLQAESL